ncbi:MAG: hypothetical protein O3A63_13150 [Proteobacteria bacterium]|nr:hypothetical protein [Pseudomonadota bacterium]
MAAASQFVLESSDLFPLLFEPFVNQERITVLDVGPGSPETVNYFSQFRCRLMFADLYSGLNTQTEPDFEDLLAFPEDTRFDICLLWDVLNYMSVDEVVAFSAHLQPFLHENSHGHGYGAFSRSKPILVSRYGVATSREVIVRPDVDSTLTAPHPHVQAEISSLLSCFSLKRRTLLQGGRLEFLLQALVTRTSSDA